jgi:hypothetical protein
MPDYQQLQDQVNRETRSKLLERLAKEYNAKQISGFAVANDTYVYTVLLDDELKSAIRNALFEQLENAEPDFLSLYKPKDLSDEYFLPTINFILSLDDMYHKCRLIQQLIDFDAYVEDMVTPIEGKEPINFLGEINSYKEDKFTVLQFAKKSNSQDAKAE